MRVGCQFRVGSRVALTDRLRHFGRSVSEKIKDRRFQGRYFLSSIVVMALFWVVSNHSEYCDRCQELDDWSQDIVMAINANRDAPRNPTLPLKQIYDIDDAAYRAWGNPVILPRDRMLSLIQSAERAGAGLIVVDIDLSRPSTITAGQTEHVNDSDRALGEYLFQLNNSEDPDRPIVILSRSLRRPLHDGEVVESALFEPVPSFVDAYVSEQKRVFWGTVQFGLEGGVIRRWRLAEAYCSAGKLGLLPSVQLLAAKAGLTSGNSTDKAIALRDLVQWFHLEQLGDAPSCTGFHGSGDLAGVLEKYPAIRASLPRDLRLSGSTGGPSISIEALARPSRIVFRIFPRDDALKRQIEVVSAKDVLNRKEVELDALGRTVLIGASFRESHDLHRRPFHDKLMPGAVIIANAIDTLEQFGEVRPAQLNLALAAIILALNLLWSVFVEKSTIIAELLAWICIILPGLWLGLIFIENGWGTFSVALLLFVSQAIHSDTLKSIWKRLNCLRETLAYFWTYLTSWYASVIDRRQ